MRQMPSLLLRNFVWRYPSLFVGPLVMFALLSVPLRGQKPPDPADAPQQSVTAPEGYTAKSSVAEVVTRDSATTFKVRVNLVLVRVVVRDEHGKVVENLKKEDFVLSDNRKPQTISTFSMDTPGSHPVSVVSVSDHPESPAAEPDRTPAVVQIGRAH